jgi:hypothetical protein
VPKRAAANGRIVVRNADYDESRYIDVRVRSCEAKATLSEHDCVTVRVEDAIEKDGRVCLSVGIGNLATDGELIITDLTPQELSTIVLTISRAMDAARRRGIMKAGRAAQAPRVATPPAARRQALLCDPRGACGDAVRARRAPARARRCHDGRARLRPLRASERRAGSMGEDRCRAGPRTRRVRYRGWYLT